MKSKTLIQKIISNPVIQTIVIYVSGAWVMIELLEYFIEHFSLNEGVRIVILIVLLCGLTIALFLAWYISRDKETASALPDIETGRSKIPESKKPFGKFARLLRRPGIFVPGLVLILLLIVAGIRYFNRQAKIRWANEQAMPEIEQLFNEMNHVAAFHLVQKAEKYIAEDPKFKELSSLVSTKFTILTDPPGADIYLKEYADIGGEWRFLGITPIDSIRMPRWTFYRWKIEKPGYETILAAAPTGFPGSLDTLYRTLHKTGEIPPDMVYVEGYGEETSGNFLSEKHGFFIDKYEVSNKQFKEFIDKGGYQNSDHWNHEFIKDEKTLSWEEAMNYFKDATGRSAPAAWQVGDYPDGKDDYPVTGISWYEAAAYAEYAGKTLPTANHWGSAAGYYVQPYSYWAGSNLIPLSNFRGNGPEPIGSSQAINYFGVYDIIGNVREWCWNKTQDGHIIRGGAWNDVTYLSTDLSQLPTFNRSEKNGFRCVLYLDNDQIPEQAFQSVKFNVQRNFYNEEPVPEAEFQIFKKQFLYDKAELNAEIQERDENPEDWIVEKISFNAAYENERMIAYLFLPKNSTPPYQTVIFFPGSYAVRETDLIKHFTSKWFLDFILKSGRAVMYPVYKGTYERNDGQYKGVRRKSHTYTEYLIKLVKDFSRSIDYLETRPDIDTAKLGFHGHSWGGRLGAIIPAVEERLKVSILNTGGFGLEAFPEADEFNYISRVKIPVLMLNGKYDFTFPLETAVKPMFDLLGTPEEHKVLKIYETDHFVPKNEMIKETLNWLDKYFGPINK
jgi:dienelactone hydrolase